MSTEAEYPLWPVQHWDDRMSAIVDTVADSVTGDYVVAHQAGCGERRGEPCSCVPVVVVVRVGRA